MFKLLAPTPCHIPNGVLLDLSHLTYIIIHYPIISPYSHWITVHPSGFSVKSPCFNGKPLQAPSPRCLTSASHWWHAWKAAICCPTPSISWRSTSGWSSKRVMDFNNKYGDVYGDDLTRQIFTRYGLNHICDIDLWLWFRFLEIGIYDLTRKNRGVMGIPSSWENHDRWRMMDLTNKNGEFSWIIRTQLMSNIPSGVITAGWEIHTSSWHLNGKIIELNGSFSTTPRLITRRYQSQQKICRDVNPNRWGAHQ